MFGKSIKRLRLENNLSLQELADKMNFKYGTSISKSMISRWENGKVDPAMYYVKLIADFFDISPKEMLEDPSYDSKIKANKTADLLAAHIDDDATPEQIQEIIDFIEFKKRCIEEEKKKNG